MLRFGAFAKRGRHWFCRTFDDVTRRYSWKTTGTGDRVLAGMWKRAAEEAEYQKLLHPNRRQTTLFQATDAWLTELTPRLRPITLRKLEGATKGWRSFFGDVDLRAIDAAGIEKFLCSRSLAPSTLNLARAHLKWFFHGFALRHGFVDADVTSQVAAYPVPERKIQTLTDPQLLSLLAETPADLIRNYVIVAVETGLRQGTILSLEWVHVDLDQGWLKVPAALMKSNRDFAAPLSARAIEALRAQRNKVSGRIFDFSTECLQDHWNAAVKRAGLPPFHLHDLRRTFLTNARRRGVPMEVAMALSDHRDLKTVLRCYRAVEEEELLRAVGRGKGLVGNDDGGYVRKL